MNENPYTAPEAEPAIKTASPQGELTSPYGAYRNVGIWRYLILSLLGLGIILSGLQIKTLLSLNHANSLAEEDFLFDESVDQFADTSGQVGQIQGILLLITVVIWCFWKNKSCKNAWLFQSATLASRMTRILASHKNVTPGWAVGSYFIPILNLWKPYQAVVFIREQVSEKTPMGFLVGLWWTAWLVANVSSNYFYRNEADEFYSTAEAISYNNGIIIDEIISVVASVLAAAVIQKLTTGQERMASDYGLVPD